MDMKSPHRITTTQVALPKGGGALHGLGEKFQPEEFTGAASLTIPIPAPPCRGLEPQLTLSYGSATGNGIFGLGFSLSLPSISRKTEKGLPTYTATDTFILAGAEDLVPLPARAHTVVVQNLSYAVMPYRPRLEGAFSRIERWTQQQTGAIHWKVVSRDNVTSLFGTSADSQIADPDDSRRVFQWLITESFDAKGNRIAYEYTSENTENIVASLYEEQRAQTANKYPSRIKYGAYQQTPPATGSDHPGDATQWHFEVVFDYGEYDTDPANHAPYTPTRTWASRRDPFSTYRAGFEVRTHRLCRNVLVFHRFAEEFGPDPLLVSVLRLRYQESPVVSLLTAVEHIGYRFQSGQGYTTKSLPPLEFNYIGFQPAGHTFTSLQEDHRSLPGLNESPAYTMIDLYGEGLPGILYRDGALTFYWEPAGSRNGKNGHASVASYARPQSPDAFPLPRSPQDTHTVLMDMTGDGRVDLVQSTPTGAGYYTCNPDHTWSAFQPFAAFPTDYGEANHYFVDLTGDGLADLVFMDETSVRCYPSLGSDGFAVPIVRSREHDTPLARQGNAAEVLRFADMFGTGMQHLVRITDGLVECWPSLGYGRFGPRVVLGNAPHFAETLDAARVFLADLDGSGTADLIYAYPDHVDIFLNQSGNAFSPPLSVPLPRTLDQFSQISFADVYGRGTNCLVFSITAPEPLHWVYDFCAGQKPYLLMQMTNNMGAVTTLSYRSSTDYYLDDKAAGRPWLTSLPFPAHVVAQTEAVDLISGSKLTSVYGYHHGYFDGVEREFRGFGLVERWDTETTAAGAGNTADPFNVPPILTKTWYHTGAVLPHGTLEDRYRAEYWQEDDHFWPLPASTFRHDGVLVDGDTRQEAQRALKGHVLRQEVYGLDGSVQQDHPYTVAEHTYHVLLLQPRAGGNYGVFFVHPQEAMTWTYERNPADPRVSHEFTLAVDEYGNVLRSCTVAYGRRQPNADALPEQLTLKVVCADHTVINLAQDAGDGNDVYLLGVPQESKSYEIVGLPWTNGQYFRLTEIAEAVASALNPAPDHTSTDITANLLSWERSIYWSPEQNGPLPLGQVSPQALLHQVAVAVGSPAQFNDAFDGVLAADALTGLLHGPGGYQQDAGWWWNLGMTTIYHGADHYYLSQATVDAFGHATTYEYDAYDLLAVKTTDALGNEMLATQVDYQTLQPQQLRDSNGNLSEVRVDPLGMVIVAAHYGQEDGQAVGFVPLAQYQDVAAPSTDDVIQRPASYLQGAGTYFFYDALCWMGQVQPAALAGLGLDASALWAELVAKGYLTADGGVCATTRALAAAALDVSEPFRTKAADILAILQHTPQGMPIHAVTLTAETYPTAGTSTGSVQPGRIQMHLTFSDGFGRELSTKARVEPGDALIVNDDGSVRAGQATDRWLSSSRTQYNNKGNPVRQYEPFYSNTYRFIDNQHLNTFEVSSTLCYDALQRHVRTVTPKGFVTRTEFGVWTQTQYDANDTLKETDYWDAVNKTINSGKVTDPLERQALEQAVLFANTPQEQVLDNLGRVVQVRNRNVAIITADAFITTLGLTSDQSAALFQELQRGGVLDWQGALTLSFQPDRAGFQLPLSAAYASYGERVVALLRDRQEAGTVLITHDERDIQDHLLATADPRLAALGKKNAETTYTLTGETLKTVTADTGVSWALHNVAGGLIFSRDGRNVTVTSEYDALQRLVAVTVQGGDGASPLNLTVERLVYGDSLDGEGKPLVAQPESRNLRGQVFLHYDQAGMTQFRSCTIDGQPRQVTRQLAADYKQEPDWSPDDPDHWSSLDPGTLKARLEATVYTVQHQYDALGRVTAQTDPAGNVSTFAYDLAGTLQQLAVVHGGSGPAETYVQSVAYNPRGQRQQIVYGNGVTTSYTYDPLDYRLMRVQTQRAAGGAALQDLAYTYDPVGNITHITDQALATVFHNNQQVTPEADYTYDALYHLVQATGREHIGLSQSSEAGGGYDPSWLTGLLAATPASPNDQQQVQNYLRRFTYDTGGNLLTTRHQAAAGGGTWTRTLAVSDSSNRAVDGTLINPAPPPGTSPVLPAAQLDAFFDANGNQTVVSGLRGLTWDYRNHLRQVVVIDRGQDPADAEYYVYDSGGQRVRKITERYRASGGFVEIEETCYLGGLEITTITRGATVAEERHFLRVLDGTRCLATRLSWVQGEPPSGVDNPQTRYQFANLNAASLEVDSQGFIISYEEYYPFGGTALIAGRSFAEVELKRYRYSGKERDAATGFYYYGARYYAPWLARWLSPDPSGPTDGLNLYEFVNGNPITFIDSDGRGKTDNQQTSTTSTPATSLWTNVSSFASLYMTPSVTSTFTSSFRYALVNRPTWVREGFGAVYSGLYGTSAQRQRFQQVQAQARQESLVFYNAALWAYKKELTSPRVPATLFPRLDALTRPASAPWAHSWVPIIGSRVSQDVRASAEKPETWAGYAGNFLGGWVSVGMPLAVIRKTFMSSAPRWVGGVMWGASGATAFYFTIQGKRQDTLRAMERREAQRKSEWFGWIPSVSDLQKSASGMPMFLTQMELAEQGTSPYRDTSGWTVGGIVVGALAVRFGAPVLIRGATTSVISYFARRGTTASTSVSNALVLYRPSPNALVLYQPKPSALIPYKSKPNK